MLRKALITTITPLLVTGMIFVGACSSDDGNEGSQIANDDSPVNLSGSLAITGYSLTQSYSDLVLFCITFEASPQAQTSEFDADGNFDVEIPRGINFGCFVNLSSDNSTIGTFVVAGEGGTLGSGQASTLALEASVDVGELSLGEDGRVVIPADRLASARYSPAADTLVVDDLHNTTYTMTCIDAGLSESFALCQEMLLDGEDSSSVFWRIIKGTQSDGKSILGLAAWRSQESFEDCGAFDLNEELTEKDGVTLDVTQGTVGEWAGDDCEVRDEGDELSRETIKDHYLLSELVKSGAGYSVRDDISQDQGGGCVTYHGVAIDFTGTNAEMYGAFSVSHVRANCDFVEGEQNFQGSFLVKFVPAE